LRDIDAALPPIISQRATASDGISGAKLVQAALRKVFVERGPGRIGDTPEKLAEHISREIAK
jgi:hypothetical protein